MNITKTIILRVVAALIVILIVSLVQLIIPKGWTTVFHYLKDNVSIIRWTIIASILVISSIVVIFLINMYRSKTSKPANYTHDMFLDISWRWRYSMDSIYDLCSFCPKCDFQIYARPKTSPSINMPRGVMIHPVYPPSESIVYQCNECEWDGKEFDTSESKIKDRITLKIQQKLRSKPW